MVDSKDAHQIMLEAVTAGDLEKVTQLVELHGLSHHQNWDVGYLLLSHALKKKSSKVIEFLLQKGAKLNSDNETNNSPLHLAVNIGQLKIVKLLICQKAFINAQNECKQTPLHLAVLKKKEKIVSLLLDHSADCSLEDIDGFTPLLIACKLKLPKIAKLLLSPKSVGFSLQPLNLALLYASTLGSEEIVLSLLDAGANPNTVLKPDDLCSKTYTLGLNKYLMKHSLCPLSLACGEGHLKVALLLLQRGAETNCIWPMNGYSVLHVASEKGYSEIVSVLLSSCTDVNVKAASYVTPLHLAAVGGHSTIVEQLLSNNADVNAQTSTGATSLLLATEHEHFDVVKILLEHSACVNTKNDNDESPLYFAVKNQNSRLVNCILQYNPDFGNEIAELVSRTVITDWTQNCYKIVKALCECGFMPRSDDTKNGKYLWAAVNKGHATIVEHLLNLGANPELNDLDSTLLHDAVKYGFLEIAEMLLNSKQEVNAKDRLGNTPIYYSLACDRFSYIPAHSSVVCDFKDKYAKIISLLLDKGADLLLVPSLLHVAVYKTCLEACKILLENGANVNALQDGFSPLQFCISDHCPYGYYYMKGLFEEKICEVQREEIFQLLLERGGDASIVTKEGYTLLHLAALHGRDRLISLLLQRGFDIDSCARDGSTALHLAAENRHDSTVEVLLKNEADVDAQRSNGDTPLLCAAAEANVQAVKSLLDFGANINAKGSTRQTALHHAVIIKHEQIITVLLNNGINVSAKDDQGRTALDLVTTELGPHGYGIYVHEYTASMLEQIANLFIRHALKLEAVNSEVCQGLLSGLALDPNELCLFQQDCEKELRRMKNEKLRRGVSLYDVLINLHYPRFVRDVNLVPVVESLAGEKYPLYLNLIKGHLKMKRKWFETLISVRTSLDILLKTSNVFLKKKMPNLPDELLEKILSYLSSKERKCLNFCIENLKHQLCK